MPAFAGMTDVAAGHAAYPRQADKVPYGFVRTKLFQRRFDEGHVDDGAEIGLAVDQFLVGVEGEIVGEALASTFPSGLIPVGVTAL